MNRKFKISLSCMGVGIVIMQYLKGIRLERDYMLGLLASLMLGVLMIRLTRSKQKQI